MYRLSQSTFLQIAKPEVLQIFSEKPIGELIALKSLRIQLVSVTSHTAACFRQSFEFFLLLIIRYLCSAHTAVAL